MLTEKSAETEQERRFRELCADLEEYEPLPELTPGTRMTQLIGDQRHEDTLDEAILAGLTLP